MAKWEIEYYNEDNSTWISLASEIDQINEDETDRNASFFIPNTPANRTLIQQDLMVNFWFDNKLQFTGILSGGDISGGKIKGICYDPIALILDQHDTFTKVYDQKPANTILADLLLGTGLTIDSSAPTTAISVVFYNANRLDVLKFIAKTCGKEYWSDDGVIVKFGVRGGSTWTPTTLKLSKRGIDRSKQVDCVRVRGLEATTGYHIVGVAGTPGGRTKAFDETTPTDVNGLNAIAAKKLAELQTDSSGAPITVLMTAAASSDNEGADLDYGDYVHLENPKYLLNGNYRILQITKSKIKATFQVDKVRRSIDKEIADLKSWENKGIYLPGSTSWSLNLQGLLVLLHLNEGEGTTAKNKAPINEPIDGIINDPYWQDGPITKLLTLNGTSSNISLGSASQAGINLTSKLSVGAWFSPSANDSTTRNVCHKDGQFALYYKVSTGILSFDLVIGGVVHTFNSDSGLITVGGRIFAMITYDGIHVCMYYNGQLHKQWTQTGTPSSSANTVYCGVFLKGALSEVMIWGRALVAQEVLELYFFPLFRVVGSASGGTSGSKWYCAISTDARYGQVSPTGLQAVNVGSDLIIQANRYAQHVFSKWLIDSGMDSETESTDNPYTFPAQSGGSTHTAWAVFTPALPATQGIPLPIDLFHCIFKQTENYQGLHSGFDGKFFEMVDYIQLLSEVSINAETELRKIKSVSLLNSWYFQAFALWAMDSMSSGVCGTTNPPGIQWKHADVAMDYYDGQDNTTLSLSIVHPSATTKYSAIGQTFAGNGSSVYVIRFKLSKYGSPSGNLKVAIYAHTGTWGSTGKPTGSGLATSNTIPITSLGANPDWVDFTFSSTYSTVNGTKYCAVLYVDTGATVDASNYVKAWYINSNGHAGNGFYYYNSAWTNWTSYDVFFAVFQTNEGVGGDIVTATPNYAGGWVLDAAYPFLWDNYWTVGQMAVDGLTAFYVPLRQVAYTTNHRLEPKYIKGWAAACTDGSCTVAYKSVNSGATTSFSSNLGSRPVDHYHYDAQGHITKTCYKQYQWLLDGNVVGTDSSSYTIPVQTDGTVHTIAVQWDGPQPE